jgi:integrase
VKTQTHPAVPLVVDYETIRVREAAILNVHHSANTQINYRSGWKHFELWCAAAGVPALPATPGSVRNFVTWCIAEGYRLETIIVRTSAISYYHHLSGAVSPVDESVRSYITQAKRHTREQPRGVTAVTADMVRRIAYKLSNNSDDPIAVRNLAMILLCFAAGWRRSELVSLQMSDVRYTPQGVTLWLRSSKTDQIGEGRLVGIHPGSNELTCPIAALDKWLALRGCWDGPLFVRFTPGRERKLTHRGLEPSGSKLYYLLKQALRQIGENPKNFGAHSLRSGMITEAAQHGASEHSIMQRTGHRSSEMIRRYIRPATAFAFNPMRGVL